MPYSVVLLRAAVRNYERLPKSVGDRIAAKLDGLQSDPQPRGTKKIVGSEACWRLRIGDYRIIYEVDDEAKKVTVLYIRHRKEAYR